MRNSIESLLTRGISIGSKFLLLGYLAKILTLNDYGRFQLVSYFILISTTIFGLEFYNVSNRKLAEGPFRSDIFAIHLNFFITLSPLVIILQVFLFIAVFPKEMITIKNIFFVMIIGLCDYLSQEVYRYLMISKEYRKGNVQLIYKSVLFLFLVFAFVFVYKSLGFSSLIVLMLVSYLFLFLFAFLIFNKTLHSFRKRNIKLLRLSDLKKHLITLWPFIVLVLFIKGIEFSDKFIIGKIMGLKEAGIYSFLFSMASVINIFIVSGFYIIYLPQLINSFASDKYKFKNVLIKFGVLTIGFSILLAIMIVLGSSYIFELIGKKEFLNHLDLLYILLLGFVLYNISLVPHLFLYVCHDEKIITVIMGFALIVNLGLNVSLINSYGIVGAAYSFLITYIVILILKSIRAFFKWKKLAV